MHCGMYLSAVNAYIQQLQRHFDIELTLRDAMGYICNVDYKLLSQIKVFNFGNSPNVACSSIYLRPLARSHVLSPKKCIDTVI